MQDIDWPMLYMPREKMNKLRRKINKVLEITPITQKVFQGQGQLKPLRFEMSGARVDPETKELLLVLKAKTWVKR